MLNSFLFKKQRFILKFKFSHLLEILYKSVNALYCFRFIVKSSDEIFEAELKLKDLTLI